MNLFHQIHFRRSKIIGIVIAAVTEAVIEAVAKTIIKSIDVLGFVGQIDDDIERECATQLFVEQGHALKNFCFLAEIIDEAILDLKLSQPDNAQQRDNRINSQHLVVQSSS